MGLRIIDRPRFVPDLSKQEQTDQLIQEMQHWSVSRGGLDHDVEKTFMDRLEKARSRRGSDQDILALAGRIENSIRKAYVARRPCHMKVNVATLLALL